MIGAICRQDILAHPLITIRCFGWKVFFRALLAGRDQTFLSLLAETSALRAASEKVPELVGRCIALELSAARIYEALARRFDQPDSVRRFFATLSRQEKEHAELLELCRAAVGHGHGEWDARPFDPWQEVVPRLEARMQEAAAQAGSVSSLSEALRLVIRLESSELNQAYSGIVAASDADFVRALGVFHDAGQEHISYVSSCVAEMEPELRDACRKLRDEYFGGIAPG